MLDATGMSRGHFFLNGVDLGKFWTVIDGHGAGMTQRYYQLPSSLLVPAGRENVLVMADELGVTAAVAPGLGPPVRVVFSSMVSHE